MRPSLFSTGKSVFRACTAPTSCQRFLGTAILGFILFFILFFINLQYIYIYIYIYMCVCVYPQLIVTQPNDPNT